MSKRDVKLYVKGILKLRPPELRKNIEKVLKDLEVEG